MMTCIRCKKEFDDTTPRLNAEFYGGNKCACPHCGKLYKFYRISSVAVISNDEDFSEDDWGNPVVPESMWEKLEKENTR